MKKSILFTLLTIILFSSFTNKEKTIIKQIKINGCACILIFHNQTTSNITNIYLQNVIGNFSGSAASGHTWMTNGSFEGCFVNTVLSWTCSISKQHSYILSYGNGTISTCYHYTGTTSSITIVPPPGQVDFYIIDGTTCITPP